MTTRIPVEIWCEKLLKKHCQSNYTHFNADQSVLARIEYQLDENTAAIGLYRDKQSESNYCFLICQNGLLILDCDRKHFIEFEQISNVPYNFLDNKISFECLDGMVRKVAITGISEAGQDMYIFYQFFCKVLFWCEKKRQRQNAGLE